MKTLTIFMKGKKESDYKIGDKLEISRIILDKEGIEVECTEI